MAEAASDNVFQFRIFCSSEGTNVTQWGEGVPTTCPNNPAHTLDASTACILSTRAKESIARYVPRSPTSTDYQTANTTVRIAGETAWRLGDRAPTFLNVCVVLASNVWYIPNPSATLTVRCYEPIRGVVLGTVTSGTIASKDPQTVSVPLTDTQFQLDSDALYSIEVHFFRASGSGQFTMQYMVLM